MKPAPRPLAIALTSAALLAIPAIAVAAAPPPAQGELGTLTHGRYVCELRGDAAGPASRPIPGTGFAVINNSSYETPGGGRGIYLLTGTRVAITRGPLRGAMFERTSPGVLERTDQAASPAGQRCVRSGPAG